MARDSREVTRARILQAARRLFLTRGFARVTIEDVAAKAGYTRGAVYSNFANKADLFLALIEERFAGQVDRAASELPDVVVEPDQRIGAFARWLAAEALRSREWMTAEVEFAAFASTDPQLSVRMMEAQRDGRAALAGLLVEQCRRLGVTPALPPEDLATVVASLIRGLTIEFMVDLSTDVAGLFAATMRQLFGILPGDTPDPREDIHAHRH